MRISAAWIVLATACGASEPTLPQGYAPLVVGDWQMPPGQEGYYCVRATITEDIYIRGFKPIAPLGTHHTALALGSVGSDGSFPCQASDAGFKLLFGSGVGTETFELPEGIAFKLPAGEQVILNLHLYNTGDEMIAGTSGVEIDRIAPEDVVHEAEVIYALNFNLSVPPGASTHTGACTMDSNSTIFGTFPHMHTLGNRMIGKAVRGGVSTVFHDQPYNFEEQLNYLVEPIDLARGDKVEYACAFQNPGTQTIQFGDSTDSEMCVLGMYRYPATGAISLCID